MIKGIHWHTTLCGVLFLFLSACASLPPASNKPLALSWPERQEQLKTLKTWKIQAAVAVHSSKESGSVSLNWQQNDQTYTMSLFGPLGSNAVQIAGKPGLVTLETADGKKFSAKDPEQLLYNQLGWKLPISNLYYWARGLPVPGQVSKQEFDALHRLTQLSQENWTLQYQQYGLFAQNELPTKIILTHPQLHIKILIYQWGI